MDDDLARGDDYLTHVGQTLSEAEEQIDAASAVFVEGQESRNSLAVALGRARNALRRAKRDVVLHGLRRQRYDDRNSAAHYLSMIGFEDDALPSIIVKTLPLPVEDESIAGALFGQRRFQADFTNWVTRFNNDERLRTPFLMEVPGGMSYVEEGAHFHFWAMAQGAREPSQEALLYSTGALVSKQRLYPWQTPPKYPLEMVLEQVRNSIKFAFRLFEELRVLPRAVAIQILVLNAKEFRLMTPAIFNTFAENVVKDGVTAIIAPASPAIAPYGPYDGVLDKVVPAIEMAFRSNYKPASNSI